VAIAATRTQGEVRRVGGGSGRRFVVFGRAAVFAGEGFVDDVGDVFVPGVGDEPLAAGLACGLDRGRRLRLVAKAGAAYCGTVLKSNVDGIGSGSCFSVPYVTTITLWSSSGMSLAAPVCSLPSTYTRIWFCPSLQ
jgi:hypothetical protein